MLVYVGHKLGPKFKYSGLSLPAGTNFMSTLKAVSAIQDQRFKITNRHRLFLTIKNQIEAIISQIDFWNETADSCEQDQDLDPARSCQQTCVTYTIAVCIV
jgi:hypothetical protein